jgi:septum formation inhibitor MinC
MSQAPSVAFSGANEDSVVEAPANVALKGTTRGLEILIAGTPSASALRARLTELLAEAPSFFAGCDARIAIDGVLPVGALTCLEEVATRFALRIVEIGPAARRGRLEVAAAPRVTAGSSGRHDPRPGKLAEGTGPVTDEGTEMRRDDPRTVRIPALPPMLRTTAESGVSAVPVESSSGAVPRYAGVAASDALVSAATALVSAATALTCEPRATASPSTHGSGAAAASVDMLAEPAGTAASIGMPTAAPGDAACKPSIGMAVDPAAGSAPIAAPGDVACKAASTAGPIAAPEDAACKAASTAAEEDTAARPTTARAASMAAPLDATDQPASAASSDPGHAASSDPGLVMALAALLASATTSEMPIADEVDSPSGPRLVIGPVRSGRIVDHVGHLIVIGDVNPGAEVRAEGSIIVLGRLRGVAHAAIGRDTGCIIALSLQPQQLRIGRMVARAGDADRPSGGAEIAYATGETIVVERFCGRLPRGLAASM